MQTPRIGTLRWTDVQTIAICILYGCSCLRSEALTIHRVMLYYYFGSFTAHIRENSKRMLDELSLLIIASGLNVLYGVNILYSIYLGDCTNSAYWIIFAILMIIIGVALPMERLITQGAGDFLKKHSILHFDKMHAFDLSHPVSLN